MRSRVAAAAALLVLAVLAGCARIPTSGPVVEGPTVAPDLEAGLRFQPLSPAEGASPEGILRGFLLAAAGVEEDHALARAYLTPRSAREWRPGTGTVVYRTGDVDLALSQAGQPLEDGREAARDAGEVTATLSVEVVATLDSGGRFVAAPPGTREEFAYTLGLHRGEWRVASMPEGLLVDEAGFALGFSSYHLYFADPTSSFLVPETRWFPDRRSVPTTLTAELLVGASPWLRDAVRTGFPDGTLLTPPAAVTVVDGVARVDLTRAALQARAEDRALMQAQLQATLLPLGAVSTVRITVEDGQLVLPGTIPALVKDPGVDPEPVALSGGRLVELRGETLVPVPDLPSLDERDVSDPAKGSASYAVLAAERSQLLHLVPGAARPEPLLSGADLTAPSFDPLNWVWSTSARSDGTVTAARPGVGVVEVDARWLEGRRIGSLRLSRDGTRALITSTDADGTSVVDVAGVVRDDSGRPRNLVRARDRSVAPALVQVRDAVWTGETSVALLGRRADDPAPRIYLSEALGGMVELGARLTADSPVVAIAAGEGERSLVAATADGTLWQRAGAQWIPVPADGPVSAPRFAG